MLTTQEGCKRSPCNFDHTLETEHNIKILKSFQLENTNLNLLRQLFEVFYIHF